MEVLADHSTDGRESMCASPIDRMGNLVRGTHLREGEAGHNVLLVRTMEDTQRSQSISTESQEIAKQAEVAGWTAKLCAKQGIRLFGFRFGKKNWNRGTV